MAVMPGVVWRPITVPGGSAARTPGRAVILHVAASEATSLFGYFNNNPNANSHFYVNKAGVIEQYVDTTRQSWASLAANKNTISVETQGGVTSPDTEPWTPAQVAALGRICAWAHATEGIPLAPMPNSLPMSRGIGWHRLGINPWRVTGGEVWSSSAGKVCPGTAKIAQIPAVIQAAIGGADMPLTNDDIAAIWGHVVPARNGVGPASAEQFLSYIGDFVTQTLAVAKEADAKAGGAAPVVDAKELAAALVADAAAVSTLADALAAAIAKRLGNG